MAEALNTKKASFGAFSVSLVVHVGLLLMISSVVISQKIVPKVPFVAESMESAPTMEEEPEVLQEPSGPPSPDVDTGPPSPTQSSLPSAQAPEFVSNVIQSSAPSLGFSLPSVSGSVTGLGAIGGGRSGGGGGTPGKVAQIFGTPIEANHLGVMLDVSGSAHPFLDTAIEEIQKSFPDALTIFVFGCGIKKDVKANVHPYSEAKPDNVKDKAGTRTTLGQMEQAFNVNKGFERMADRMSKRNDVFYVYGGDIFATEEAFRKLLSEKVDAIYWFADFMDAVDANVAKDIAKDLSRANIKLYAHNFAGKPIRVEVQNMVKETDGKAIVQAPKK